MNNKQEKIVQELITSSIKNGFDSCYPLQPIADKLGIKEVLYDNNTNTGLLWELGRFGSGILDISTDGKYASIDYNMSNLLKK